MNQRQPNVNYTRDHLRYYEDLIGRNLEESIQTITKIWKDLPENAVSALLELEKTERWDSTSVSITLSFDRPMTVKEEQLFIEQKHNAYENKKRLYQDLKAQFESVNT